MGLDSVAWVGVGAGTSGSPSEGDDPSVTHVGEAALIRTTSVDIGRGALLAGRYQVEAAIGKGGSGIVLRAFDRVAQVPVAVKILKPELASDPRWVERFSRELRLARRIQNANVCRVFDIGQADGHWFITMELASGGSLRDQIRPASPLRLEEERLTDLRAVVAGLAAIHESGIVHRDLKPDNFLRMEDGRLVLSDFGLATNPSDASTVSILVGTPSYMAPEVVVGDTASLASDVWSLGVVMHEILFGKRPEWTSGAYRRVSLPPRRDLSLKERALALLVEECIQDDAASRPRDGREVQRRFEIAVASTPQRRLWPLRATRARWAWPLIAVGAAAVAAIVSGHVWRGASASLSPSLLPAAGNRTAVIHGVAADWTTALKVVASFHEPVACLSWQDPDRVLRLVVGTPRRAIDVDVETSAQRPAPLAPQTFAIGCPQLSRRGPLLFERFDDNGRKEIMLAANGDVGHARPMVVGSEPAWLPSGDEFIYTADDNHAAVFSVPVMSTTIISETPDAAGMLVEKIVSDDGGSFALRYMDRSNQKRVVVHEMPSLAVKDSLALGAAVTDFQFGGGDGKLIFAAEGSRGRELWDVDAHSGEGQRLGVIPGRNLGLLRPGRSLVAMTSFVRQSEIWSVDNGTQSVQLTHDGINYYPSLSRRGDLIVEHVGLDGRFSIVLHARGVAPNRVTEGPMDLTPSFLPDGAGWLYVDAPRLTIRRCRFSGECEDLLTTKEFPFLPTASPSGEQVAYFTVVGRQRLKVLAKGGTVRDLGPAQPECRPYWVSESRLWTLRGTDRSPVWTLVDVSSGEQIETLPINETPRSVAGDCPFFGAPPGALDPPRAAAWGSDDINVGVLSAQQLPGIGQNP